MIHGVKSHLKIEENFMPNINEATQRQVDIRALQEQAVHSTRRRRNATVVGRSNNQLDKSSFLKLLIKQLEHQDPLQPVSDREFIAQMAQFSSLEQMQNIATSMKSMKSFQANFLVGKNISGKDFVTGQPVEGVVDQVLFDANQQVFLRVKGRRVKFNDLISVGAKTRMFPQKPANNTKDQLSSTQQIDRFNKIKINNN